MTEFDCDNYLEDKQQIIEIVKKSLKSKGYDISRPKFGSYDSIQQSFTVPIFRWKGKSECRINTLIRQNIKKSNKQLAEQFMSYNSVEIKGKKASVKLSGTQKRLTVTLYRGCKKLND